MNKSILVMDTPNACIDCPCHFTDDGTVWCGKERKEILADDITAYKPDWCPLREVPRRKPLNPAPYYAWKSDIYNFAWNACIDEILNENDCHLF